MTPPTETPARERIMQVAGDLFFRNGYRAIGIDMIIAESGVAKATLYRHFPSKDALIAAYLEEVNTAFWKWFNEAAAQAVDPVDQIVSVFAALQKMVTTPTCYGCPFLMAATEFPAPDHPGHLIARRNKEGVRARLREMCQQAGLSDASSLADHLLMLMDGAFMAVRLYGIDNPAQQMTESVRHLLRT